MSHDLLIAFLFIFLAEMGDKTQLLAMALAAKYRTGPVMAGILAATLLNHALAIVVARGVAAWIPAGPLHFTVAVSFILFGLWILKPDTLEGEAESRVKFNPFWTTAVLFFFAEMGDKTQLATAGLALQSPRGFIILFGTTAGMLAADGLGILLGVFLKRRIPEQKIRIAAATLFILFGLAGLVQIFKP
ncbi:MAG: hypothetical protein A2Y02_01305 [Omnitrophica bacterium GWA2_52_12]|nr:MAG: hypothetical protein A2Y02_01305 [Omnitrophica bacterium GWA2_52_12]